MALAVVAMMLAVAMPALSAPPLPHPTPIIMPADLAGAGGQVEISGIGTFGNGDSPNLPSGQNVSWRLKVNGQTSQWYTKNVDCTALDVSQYCNMEIKNVPAGGTIDISGTGSFTNGNKVILPTGVTISWRLKVNGQTSQWYTKNVDCTPLDAGSAAVVVGAICDMAIKMPAELAAAGGKVEISGTGTFTNGQSVILPSGVTISWRLKVNGQTSQWYTKNVDCTPLDASKAVLCQTSDARCTMKINNPAGGSVEISGTGSFTDGQSVVLPSGVTISWRLKVNGQTSQWYTKNVDCTPLAVSQFCNMLITNPAGGTVEISGTGTYANGDKVVLPSSVTISWRLKVNGQTSQYYTKNVDCTALVVDQFCNMLITNPAGGTVEISGTGSFTDGQSVILPSGVTISWRLKVNGQTSQYYTKNVDCTELKVIEFCNMNIIAPADAKVEISGTGTFTNGQSVVLPTGVTISYRVNGGVWKTKPVDCSDLVGGL
jgi:hypothetical protein